MILTKPFGRTLLGKAANLYEICVGKAKLLVSDFGATWIGWMVENAAGTPTDLVLGFDSVAPYDQSDVGYMGATVGRVAGRIGEGKLFVEDALYQLPQNEGKTHLHGGPNGLHRQLFALQHQTENSITLRAFVPHLSDGYPGDFTLDATFCLEENGTVCITYEAICTMTCPISITNHAYFNLNGADSQKDVGNHLLLLHAKAYCPADELLVALGTTAPLQNTPLDFSAPAPIKKTFSNPHPTVASTQGIDHNFVLEKDANGLAPAAELHCIQNGMGLQIETTQPTVQIYTANMLASTIGKRGAVYQAHSGICLETQGFPNAVNCPGFSCRWLHPGEVYEQTTRYVPFYL